MIKTISKKKKGKKAKCLSEEDLEIAEKRRLLKGKGEKERYIHLNAEFQTIARRYKKAFLGNQCKEIEGNNTMGKTKDLFKKIRAFHAKRSTIKDRHGIDLTEAEDIKNILIFKSTQKNYIKKILMTQIKSEAWSKPGVGA